MNIPLCNNDNNIFKQGDMIIQLCINDNKLKMADLFEESLHKCSYLHEIFSAGLQEDAVEGIMEWMDIINKGGIKEEKEMQIMLVSGLIENTFFGCKDVVDKFNRLTFKNENCRNQNEDTEYINKPNKVEVLEKSTFTNYNTKDNDLTMSNKTGLNTKRMLESNDIVGDTKKMKFVQCSFPITIFTWNIAECMPSAACNWDSDKCVKEIKNEILAQEADFICIQEAPTSTFDLGVNYAMLGAVATHCGYTQLFVRNSWKNACKQIKSVGPSVCALFEINSYKFGVSCLHLAPCKENSKLRLSQILDIVNSFKSCSFFIAGDTNFRKDEAAEFLSKNLSVIDAHQLKNKGFPYTWNSQINKYHQDGFNFSCNFDRIFVDKNFKVINCSVCCNDTKSRTAGHFLSDHFALKASIDLVSKST